MTKREKKYHRSKKAGYGFRSLTYEWDESDQPMMITELFNLNDKNSPFYLPPRDSFSNLGILFIPEFEKNSDGFIAAIRESGNTITYDPNDTFKI